jgi:transcriptional regulator with XRE-family HTH domain
MNLTLAQKKEWAKLLYLKEKVTQKEIAEKVHVTEKTLSKWVNLEKWETLKASITITKEEALRRIYMQINEINAAIQIKPEGQRYAKGSEANDLSKLCLAAKSLESEASISDVMEVFKRFICWVRPLNLEKAKEIIVLQDSFIRTLLT